MRSGRYINKKTDDTLHLDIPPRGISLDCVSGELLVNGQLVSHWFAHISLNPESGKWHGDIIKSINSDFEKVTIWKTSEDEIDIFLYKTGHAIKQSFVFESAYFRELTIKINYQSGTSPLLEYDTTKHRDFMDYHPSVPRELLSLESILKRCGVQLNIKEASALINSRLVQGETWSDAELNYAMSKSWSDRPADKWTLWVLFADELGGHPYTSGRMFDFEGKNQREGVVVFVNDLRIKPDDDKDTIEDKQRSLFWTLLHEIGHAFNLGHSHDRMAHNMWIPFANEMEERSYMNYPENTSDDYFKSFNHQFSPAGLRFLRHAPDEMVRMGGAPWFDQVRQGQINAQSSSGLKLKLRKDKDILEFMEPAMIEVQLQNKSGRVIEIDENCLRNAMNLAVSVTYNESEKFIYKNFVYDCFRPKKVELGIENDTDEGHILKEPMFVAVGKDGWIIQTPGKYEIEATLFLEDESLVSNTIKLEVEEGSEEMQKLSDHYFTKEVGRIYAFDGTYSSENGNRILKEIVENHSSSMAAIHAKVALAMPFTKDFKTLDGKTGLSIQEADKELARESLQWALNQDASEETLGKLDYQFYNEELNKLTFTPPPQPV